MFRLRSQITIKLLRYFFLNPEKKPYINQLAKELGVDPANLFRKLRELEKEGVLFSEKQGNQRHYGLNLEYPWLDNLKRHYQTRHGLADLLEARLKDLSGLQEVYLFGSGAKGELEGESDLDLILVGNHSSIAAKKAVFPLEKEIGREINLVNLSEKDFKKRKKQKDDFVGRVMSGKTTRIL